MFVVRGLAVIGILISWNDFVKRVDNKGRHRRRW
jgi:hypothetical protein